MKLSKQSRGVLILSALFYLTSVICLINGQEKNKESICVKYGLSDCSRELNSWDYFGVIVLLFALITTVALIWTRKLDN